LLAMPAWSWSPALVRFSSLFLYSCLSRHSLCSPLHAAPGQLFPWRTVSSRPSVVALEEAFDCSQRGESAGSLGCCPSCSSVKLAWPLGGDWSTKRWASPAGSGTIFQSVPGTAG
jgi:hypothetical protein